MILRRERPPIRALAERPGRAWDRDEIREVVIEACEQHGIVFIASGAFHMAKPSDLIPELQGRVPRADRPVHRVSVVFSTASKWLSGQALPRHDRLQVLAALFNAEPHVLRFGGKLRVGEERLGWTAQLGPQDREMIHAFVGLPSTQRKLVHELVSTLAEAVKRGV